LSVVILESVAAVSDFALSLSLILSVVIVRNILIWFRSRALCRFLLLILGDVGLLFDIPLLFVRFVGFLDRGSLIGGLFSDSPVIATLLGTTPWFALGFRASRVRSSRVVPLLLIILVGLDSLSHLSHRLSLRTVLRHILVLGGEPSSASEWRASLAGGPRCFGLLVLVFRLCQIFLFEGLEHSYTRIKQSGRANRSISTDIYGPDNTTYLLTI